MNETSLTIVLTALADKIRSLECEVYYRESEIKRLKEQLAKKEDDEDAEKF